MKAYFYSLLRRYISLFVLEANSVIEVDPSNSKLVASFPNGKLVFREPQDVPAWASNANVTTIEEAKSEHHDFVLISGLVHYDRDIQSLLADVRSICTNDTRLILTYYSALWKPFATLASRLGWRNKLPESNWLAHEDIQNLIELENFELIRADQKVLIPFYIPLISEMVNRYLAPLPFIRNLCLLNIAVARPRLDNEATERPSVSVVVPARNEAGNIENIIRRMPLMGPKDEIIFIEGNSTDNTWETIQNAAKNYRGEFQIQIAQQDGKGKGDAVRKGFAMAQNEILMILDADITVPPEGNPPIFNGAVE
jgi:hypothetical protein